MRIGLISDTHGQLRPEVFGHFEGVDLILHAGDVGDADILIELETIAPVHAVVGNTDLPPLADRLPMVQSLELEGRSVVVTHGHMMGVLTPERLRREHPSAHVIVYGHTHVPKIDRAGASLVVNPGAAGPARFKLKPSIAILELTRDNAEVTLIELGGATA